MHVNERTTTMLTITDCSLQMKDREDAKNMNQLCKVCDEPAAGFHFGAFTCEGCKSFFGRTYNNLSSLSECKNNGRCIINKKTRTSCKSCRLRKCLVVGMSKGGSRYGRRSNWFKIHYLMQSSGGVSQASNPNSSSSENVPSSLASNPVPLEASPTIGSPPLEPFSLKKDFGRSRQNMLSHEFPLTHDLKRDSGYKPGSTLGSQQESYKLGLPYTNANSPNSSSTDSPSCDNLLPRNDKALLPYLNEQIYPKDVLNIYSMPTMVPRAPSCMMSTSLPPRYFYPYYPSLLSIYTRRHYLSQLLKEVKQTGLPESPSPSPAPPMEGKTNREGSPPLSDIKMTPTALEIIPVFKTGDSHRTETSAIARSVSSLPQIEAEPLHASAVIREGPHEEPVDLRVKDKSSKPKEARQEDRQSSPLSEIPLKLRMPSSPLREIQVKLESERGQESPLNLSADRKTLDDDTRS